MTEKPKNAGEQVRAAVREASFSIHETISVLGYIKYHLDEALDKDDDVMRTRADIADAELTLAMVLIHMGGYTADECKAADATIHEAKAAIQKVKDEIHGAISSDPGSRPSSRARRRYRLMNNGRIR